MKDALPALLGGKPVREKKKFLIFGSPKIENDEIEEVVDCLKSGWIGTGPKVSQFESDFSEYIGSSHCIALNSCTAALHLALRAIDLKSDEEVITTPMTFGATANAIIHAGGVPVFVDCDQKTMNIDPNEIRKKINKKTKAILPVHFAGRPCDMNSIMEISQEYKLKVIEDCAHAVETKYNGKKAGLFGDIGCYSFYVTKNVVTGEGGMVATENEEYANSIKTMSLHGMTKDAWKRYSDNGYKHYEIVNPGYKNNMMDLQAAIGIHQLKRVDSCWKRREEIWNYYNEAFADLPCFLPPSPDVGTRHAYHLYTVLVDLEKLKVDRDTILSALTAENIGVGVHYIALHLHPYYRKALDYNEGDFVNAEWISKRTISLPLSAKLSDDDIQDVVKAVTKLLTYYSKV